NAAEVVTAVLISGEGSRSVSMYTVRTSQSPNGVSVSPFSMSARTEWTSAEVVSASNTDFQAEPGDGGRHFRRYSAASTGVRAYGRILAAAVSPVPASLIALRYSVLRLVTMYSAGSEVFSAVMIAARRRSGTSSSPSRIGKIRSWSARAVVTFGDISCSLG